MPSGARRTRHLTCSIAALALYLAPTAAGAPVTAQTRAVASTTASTSQARKSTPRPLPKLSDATSTATAHWRCIRQAESGGDYRKANGLELYGGAYQFDPRTWTALGFPGVPSSASPAVQDRAALKEYAWALRYFGNGFQPWQTAPSCGV